MNVLILHPIQDISAGSTKALLNIVTQANKKGIDITVAVPGHGALNNALDSLHIPYANINFRFALLPDKYSVLQLFLLVRRYIINSIAGLRLAYYARKHHIDILHSNVSVIDAGYIASRLTHIPHIYHIREYGEKDFGWKNYIRKKRFFNRLKSAKQYNICITKDIQQYNKQTKSPNSQVIYDGVLSNNDSIYNPNKKPYILFVGRLLPAKGFKQLLQAYVAYSKCCKEPLPLYVAGDSNHAEYKQQLQQIIHDNQIEDKVLFLGMRNDVLQLDREAQALIVPSLSEGFGFITTEAIFSGCLVVGNDVAGTKEQFDNGKQITGEEIALRYTTQEQLVQHLIDITNAVHDGTFTAKYESMILRGQQVATQLYTTEHNAEQIINFYQKILAQ